ncbi:hypothetical protein THAOC_09081 [Thalassiosira oceanica]|uniref:Uncharacterized protein n=1 Tax=Thalassiosira oceanica TaxID=159749 RepID=K0SXH2_THAOC|nr:hypothetical protein THAOC_09081 [Thalassiosira oceanica]|eukprot:EJK69639.1 hypothetical protein THAOC_09081 [Thalassiosira oceanica]
MDVDVNHQGQHYDGECGKRVAYQVLAGDHDESFCLATRVGGVQSPRLLLSIPSPSPRLVRCPVLKLFLSQSPTLIVGPVAVSWKSSRRLGFGLFWGWR